ncbi:hypothetical protein TPA0910_41500 [Streptomyces hygroscopicus subsp. sporocinereus]|uniref:Uncharacterized protein n=1 Tax=Streptomyces hygroscopicus TaxID=1912 RepID=A0ABQ3U274_STRHY|nr:hypothetical protein TPA0910_41500 [Streptomyces hygroscopicus]
MGKASATQKMAPGSTSMSEAFSPRNASGKPTVTVGAPTPRGDEAVVPTAEITVGGKPRGRSRCPARTAWTRSP